MTQVPHSYLNPTSLSPSTLAIACIGADTFGSLPMPLNVSIVTLPAQEPANAHIFNHPTMPRLISDWRLDRSWPPGRFPPPWTGNAWFLYFHVLHPAEGEGLIEEES